MHVEAGGGSIGVFPEESAREYAAAGRLFFAWLRALTGEEPELVVLEAEESPGLSRSSLIVAPETMIDVLLPTGRANWRIVLPKAASGYHAYWDLCQHFVTLVDPDSGNDAFQGTVCAAVEEERDRLGVVLTTNWDAQQDSE